MSLIQKRAVHSKSAIVFLIAFFSSSVYSDTGVCKSYKKLYQTNNHQQILINWERQIVSDQCSRNIVALVKIATNQRAEGLKMLADLSRGEYAPATVNLGIELEEADESNAFDVLVLYQIALQQSLIGGVSYDAFNLSWGRGNNLIARCKVGDSHFCKSLKEDQIERFRMISDGAISIAKNQISESLSNRQAVESAILGVLTIGTALMIKNAGSSSARSAKAPLPKLSNTPPMPTNSLGLDNKTYLCVLGHISSGATRSTCH